MVLAIIDSLLTVESNAQTDFVDSQNVLNQAYVEIGNIKVDENWIDFNEFKPSFQEDIQIITDHLQNINPDCLDFKPPLSWLNTQAELSELLQDLLEININNLWEKVDSDNSLGNPDITNEINRNFGNLTLAIPDDTNSIELDKYAINNIISPEFQEFLNNVKNLSTKTLEEIIPDFYNLLDKLEKPEEWLDKLGLNALTENFIEQIREIKESLPHRRILTITAEINNRSQLVQDYDDFLASLSPNNLDQTEILEGIEKTNILAERLNLSNLKIDISLEELKTFNVEDFQKNIRSLPDRINTLDEDPILSNIFASIESFVEDLKENPMTTQLTVVIQQIQSLIQRVIEKVTETVVLIFSKIADVITTSAKSLDKVFTYLETAIVKVENFVDEADKLIYQVVQTLKKSSNRFADNAVNSIEKISENVHQQTEKIEAVIKKFDDQIKDNLSQENLENIIKNILSQVTDILDNQAVKSALEKSEKGVKQIVDALENISLDPAFKSAVNETNKLEKTFKEIDFAKLGTAQKTSLKLGAKIIQEVDLPGTVKPELESAFNSIVDPLSNLVNSIQAESKKIGDYVEQFKPSVLVDNFLGSYISDLITVLEVIKPSVLLNEVQELYEDLLNKLYLLNPDSLFTIIDNLYEKLENAINPAALQVLTDFLRENFNTIKGNLDKIKEGIVNNIFESLGNLESLLVNLGIDNINDTFKLDFWQKLVGVLSLNFQDIIKNITTKIISQADKVNVVKIQEELQELWEAIADYSANSEKDVIQLAIAELNQASENYQNQTLVDKFKQWDEKNQSLKDFACPSGLKEEYTELVKILEKLSEDLQQEKVSEIDGIINEIVNNLQLDIFDIDENEINSQIMTAFQAITHDTLTKQLINPISQILISLDTILEEPRNLVNQIQEVITKLIDTPKYLTDELGKLTREFTESIDNTINTIKTKINDLDNLMNNFYQEISNKVKELNPVQILNFFYDVSDFKHGSTDELLAKLNQNTENDQEVSQYFLAKLTPEQSEFLLNFNTNRVDADRILIEGLNQLLKDNDFFQQGFPANVPIKNLPLEAQNLISELNTSGLNERGFIRLNRLLLEFTYGQEIIKSLQSIYPFLVESLIKIYPEEIVQDLDEIHGSVVKSISNLSQALGNTLDEEYEKILEIYDFINQQIAKIFAGILSQLDTLKVQMGNGLDDTSIAFNRLLAALPS